MILRDYQIDAINKTAEDIRNGIKRPLIVAPTASGKSVIFGGIIARALEKSKDRRILSLCYSSEILEQNESALRKIMPSADTGIFCAGAGRKEPDRQVVFASRDSLGPRPKICGDFDLILVDEAHQIAVKEETRYQKIFSELNPKWIVGASGTPWRCQGGNIWGPGGFFEKISYNISLDFLIEQGRLCRYTFPKLEALIKGEGLKTNSYTGDFAEDELEKASLVPEVVKESVDTWHELAFLRRTTLVFCCSVAHAQAVTEEFRRRLGSMNVAYIDGKTPRFERDYIIEHARLGGFKVIVNVGVLTTGVDIPPIDCILMLRATKSASLFVQCMGRGLRTFPGKEDLLIVDVTDNFDRFESLSNPKRKQFQQKLEELEQDGEFEQREAPTKECPGCRADLPGGQKVCSYCGHLFISAVKKPHVGAPNSGWFLVESYYYYESQTKKGNPCVVAVFKLKDVKKPITQWYISEHSNDFVQRNGRMNIARIKHNYINGVFIQDRLADFPKISRYQVDPSRSAVPMLPADAMDFRNFG